MRSLFLSLLAVALSLLGWVAIPSSAFFHPVAWRYDSATGQATMQRGITWPGETMTVKWAAQISGAPGEPVCTANGLRENRVADSVITYHLDSDLRACADKPGAQALLSWSVMVLGIIPLRPVYMRVPASEAAR